VSHHSLLLTATPELAESSTDFLWSARLGDSSFKTTLGPGGQGIGRPVPSVAADLLRIAVLTYLVDRTVPREQSIGDQWTRDIDLSVPVSSLDWETVSEPIAGILNFLTGDLWSLSFTHDGTVAPRDPLPTDDGIVSLFSGGADSYCGALRATRTERLRMLVSHSDWSITSGVQNACLNTLRRITGERAPFLRVDMGRQARQVGTNIPFPKENTSRSRSLLFLAIAVAVAAAHGHGNVWIPENGFVSLNLPLAGERRGALTTRTSNPALLEAFNELLAIIGLDVVVTNPFARMTKGEMFSEAAREYGPAVEAALAETRSCARTNFNFRELPPQSQCGICYACLVRRAAFTAAGILDTTEYVDVGGDAPISHERLSDVRAVQYATKRTIHDSDLMMLRLPADYTLDTARDVIERGLAELRLTVAP